MDSTVVLGDLLEAVLLMVEVSGEIDSTTFIGGIGFQDGGDGGLVLDGASPRIHSCSVAHIASGSGIHCFDGASPSIAHCRVSDCAVSGLLFEGVPRSQLSFTTVSANAGAGIHIIQSGVVGINDSDFLNNADAGILIEHTAKVNVDRCTISSNPDEGLEAFGCDSIAVSDCLIAENGTYAAVSVEQGDVRVVQNTFFQNNEIALVCAECTANVLNNEFLENTGEFVVTGAGGSLTICDNVIHDNRGMAIEWGAGEIWAHDNSIVNNDTFEFESGAAVALWSAWGTVAGNTIMRNIGWDAGGLQLFSCGLDDTLLVTENWIVQNSAPQGFGGGVLCYGGAPVISDNMICENAASSGGGLSCWFSATPIVTGNCIVRNYATDAGGGIHVTDSSPQVVWNTVAENQAHSQTVAFSDGVYSENSSWEMTQCNLARNGGGFHNATYQQIPLIQSNWWDDASGPWHGGANPTGAGDSLSTYAYDFIPWLAAADTLAPPVPPSDLVITDVGSDFLLLDWSPVLVMDLAGYRVYFDTDTTGFPYAGMIDAGDATSYLLEGLEGQTVYYVAVTCIDTEGDESWFSNEQETETIGASGVEPDALPITSRLLLRTGAPNPFRTHTQITYRLPEACMIRLSVHNLEGREIAVLAEGMMNAGQHTAVWQGHDARGMRLSPGIYFTRLNNGETSLRRKIVKLE